MSSLARTVFVPRKGIFPEWQPAYAERRIATFPLRPDKRPAVTNWQRMGMPASNALAAKFENADAFGFITGRRSRITVLDIDSPDQRVAEDAMQRHGEPEIIVRTASHKFHLLYKYNGERRRIRPWRPLPIDLLGDGGYAVAAPSLVAKGTYEFIKGRLDDIDRLTPMAGLESLTEESKPAASSEISHHPIPGVARNNALFKHCMRMAHKCSNFDALLAEAHAANARCVRPLDDEEVMKTATSAWSYEERGLNRFGQHGAWFPMEEVASLLHDEDVFVLLAFLRAGEGPWATFMVANGLAEKFRWSRKRMAEARHRLIELGYLQPVRQAGRGAPALFQWLR